MNAITTTRKPLAVFLLVVFIGQIMYTPALALTGGPAQPESQAFQPAGTTEMVDLFSGDFSYNIPLFELPGPNGGYPFNLSYQSGITMEQEASWVGLGWSLNPGAINRQMRGLPDEFKGDSILTKMSIAPSITIGAGTGVGVEFVGKDAKTKEKTWGLSASSGLSVSLNNYKGISYSIDNSLGFGRAAGGPITPQLQLSTSLNSSEGVSVQPYVGIAGKIGEVGLGVGYNSKTGLNSVSITGELGEPTYRKNAGSDKVSRPQALSGSYSISLSHPGYTPQVTMPMQNFAFKATVKFGAGWNTIFGNAYGSGFYNEQKLKDDKKTIKTNVYGYLNYQHATHDGDLLDINREKEGMVSQDIPNLAIPSLTYDIYTVTGQGIGAMYRPFRNDQGIIHDKETESTSVDVGAGVDIGIPLHVGGNLQLNHAKSTSGKWTDNNAFAAGQPFQDFKMNDAFEPWYFKVHGEASSETIDHVNAIGGDDAVRVELNGDGSGIGAGATLENRSFRSAAAPNGAGQNRKSRNQVVQPITNGQLLSGSGVGSEVASLFKVNYITSDSTSLPYHRTRPRHHFAGITAVTPEGLRYTYAIPAYNTYQEDVTFTAQKLLNAEVNKVNGNNENGQEPVYAYPQTEKYFKSTKMPPYAHSYLLTSIVGPDYVDVTDNGVTSDDLGYWVSFTYQQKNAASDPYQWRDPYSQAHYQEGWKTDPRDDKGSFTYGTKEMWYLAKAETKSHIAVFKTLPREDGKGVVKKLQDHNLQGKSVYKLAGIDLYSRSARNNYKIKSVKFEHDYTLCKGVPNSSTGQGKLTLKKVWFEYGGTRQGRLNPYVFGYDQANGLHNPDYNSYAYDRWGNYKPNSGTDLLQNIDAPYSLQNPAQKKQIDNYAAAWSLTDIRLPSGGDLHVDYESDDYAYVQQQPAMQMMELVDPYSPSTGVLQPAYLLKDNDLKVRFKLKKPVAHSSGLSHQDEVMSYLDKNREQLYFKIKINLRRPGDQLYEYIAGYADIDFTKPMMLEDDASGKYGFGSFYVKAIAKHHPFSARAWQHLRTNQPELANSGGSFTPATTNAQRIDQIKSVGSIIVQVRQMFEGFDDFCSKENWGREIVANKSWARLVTPDKTKFGGGLRVKQITMKDQWKQTKEGTYGQVYEYTKTEGDKTISSGVAAYEPIIGGEENAIRYAKKFSQSVPLRSDNNLFFEYPINESYYPGAQVGYSKVTVTSLASAYLAGAKVDHIQLSDTTKTIFPKGPNVSFGTTGVTVHEFYTAKDFPIITDETDKKDRPFKLNITIPFLGSIATSNLTTSQGYSIVTNDMHGKQKMVSNYRQDRTGKRDPNAISWVKYNYRADSASNQLGNRYEVLNVFSDNGDGTLSLPDGANSSAPKRVLGQETEFFTDMREFKDNAWGGGANINTDGIFLLFGVIPIPSWWPNVSKTKTLLRTSVSNKIIFKTGILESTEAFDNGSHVVTRNLKWDKQTGAPLLTVVTNNFDAPVYSYSIPAHTQYPGMRAAYQNVGVSFNLDNVIKRSPDQYEFSSSLADDLLYPGDELALYVNDVNKKPIAKAIYLGDASGVKQFYCKAALLPLAYKATVLRSGYRNQLSVMAGSMTSLKDPTIPGSVVSYEKTVVVPAGKN